MISIMIMSYNNEELLKTCISRIKQFTPIDYELVIVDDASDVPYQIENATVVRMPKRSNCCNLRNVGMEMCSNDLVFWLDNDTMVGEGWYLPLLETMKDGVGLVGQKVDSRLIRKPFLPLTQADCMIEYQFAYDYNHLNGECDFITSYCVLVRKSAYRPTHCWGMPTPCLDPELGAVIKANGYKVVVCDKLNITHLGSQTPRPQGKDYLYHLAENFTKWWKFWEPYSKMFEIYKGDCLFEQDANEPNRILSKNSHGDYDK